MFRTLGLLIAAFAFVACGPAIDPGTYDYDADLKRNTCGFEVDQTTRGEMSVIEDEGDYRITVTPEGETESFTYKGEETDDGDVEATLTYTESGCSFNETMTLESADAGPEGKIVVAVSGDCVDNPCEFEYDLSAE